MESRRSVNSCFLFALFVSLFLRTQVAEGQESTSAASHWNVNTQLVSPNASDATKRLYQFLYDNYGRKIISGVMTLNSFDETNWLLANTGKEPALVGLDFMHCGRSYQWYNELQPIDDARTYYNKNGIPALCWHWRDPSRQTEEFYTAKTSFDVSKVFETASAEYKAMIADIDYISSLLKKLQSENIPVIWRPLHEAKGGWFWWGAKGPEACKQLYRLMFDRMVNYHGLNNLIWVWTREPGDDAWYPGDEYVDIVGRDLYAEGNHSSQYAEWTDMHNRYNGKKLITLSECGSFPDPDNLIVDGAAWSWFMPWYGGFVKDSKHNPLELWQKAMHHDYVITLDEMPDLKTYEPQPHPVVTKNAEVNSSRLRIYPTEFVDSVHIESDREIGTITLVASDGQRISEFTIRQKAISISLGHLARGLYFIKQKNVVLARLIKR